MQEEWRPVVGYEGWYDISNLGRVRRARPGKATYVGKILKPSTRPSGRLTAYLRCEGRDRQCEIHRLVAAAFLGPCPRGKEVNHIDGVPSNNQVTNLEYVTRRENVLHAYRLGLLHAPRGEDQHLAKLKTEHVMIIRAAKTVPATILAQVFGVTKATILAVRKLRTWKHI